MGLMDWLFPGDSSSGPVADPNFNQPEASGGLFSDMSWDEDWSPFLGGAGKALSQLAAGDTVDISRDAALARKYRDDKEAKRKYEEYMQKRLDQLDSYSEKAKKSGNIDGGEAIKRYADRERVAQEMRETFKQNLEDARYAFGPMGKHAFNQAAGIKEEAAAGGPPTHLPGLLEGTTGPAISPAGGGGAGSSSASQPPPSGSAVGGTAVEPAPGTVRGPGGAGGTLVEPYPGAPYAPPNITAEDLPPRPDHQVPPAPPLPVGAHQQGGGQVPAMPMLAPPPTTSGVPASATPEIHAKQQELERRRQQALQGVQRPLPPQPGPVGIGPWEADMPQQDDDSMLSPINRTIESIRDGLMSTPSEGDPDEESIYSSSGETRLGPTVISAKEMDAENAAEYARLEGKTGEALNIRADLIMDRYNVSPRIRDIVKTEAERIGIPPSLAAALIAQESEFKADAIGPETEKYGSAKGLMQFIDLTAKDEGLKEGEVFDPEKAIPAGLKYLKKLHNKYGNWPDALAAYNWGTGNLDKAKAKAKAGDGNVSLPKETEDYLANILGSSGLAETSANPQTAAEDMLAANAGEEDVKMTNMSAAEKDGLRKSGLGPRAQQEVVKTPAFQANAKSKNNHGPTLGAARLMEVENTRMATKTGTPVRPLFSRDVLELAMALGPDRGGALLANIAAKAPTSPWEIVNAGDGNVFAVNKYNPEQTLQVAGAGGSASAKSTMGKTILDAGGDPTDPRWQQWYLDREKDLRRVSSSNPMIDVYRRHNLPNPKQGYEWALNQERTAPLYNEDGRPYQIPIAGGPEDPSEKKKKRLANAREVNETMLLGLLQSRNILQKNIRSKSNLPATGFLADYIKFIGGTDAADLQEALRPVIAGITFTQLRNMREASPTGGALGQVSNFENLLMGAIRGSLMQNQSPQQLMATIDRLIEEQNRVIYGHKDGYGAFLRENEKQTAWYDANNVPEDERFRINHVDRKTGLRFKGGDPKDPSRWEDISNPSEWLRRELEKAAKGRK